MSQFVYRKHKKYKGIKQNPSLLGFGCMRFPKLNEDQPDIDEVLSEKMIDYAIVHGVNYFDTAYPYHHGLSEIFIGKVLKKYPRDSFYLASKMPSWLIHSVDDVKRIFEEQLIKCQVDYFDYYLCHALDKKMFKAYLIPGVMDYLYEMKEIGKIKHLGFSFHDTPEVLEEIINTYSWDFVQLQINYLDWAFQNAQKQYEIVETYGVPCIVMEPVRGGTLATLCEESKSILKAFNPDTSIASWAIRYAASKSNVMLVLSGMSDLEQTKDNIQTLTNYHPISPLEQTIIDQALKVFLDKLTIPCTACSYCMPCPYGVDIPTIFDYYNQYAVSKYRSIFIRSNQELDPSKQVTNCVACGECISLCPQKIDIPTHMENIRSLLENLQK